MSDENTPKALIMDDDPLIRGMVKSMLENEGFHVTDADNGQDGVEILYNKLDPSSLTIIVLDVIMPGMTGLEVLSRIKAESSTQRIPVIMLTGETKTDDIMAGYSGGADYYITKPFTRQQLIYGVNLVLGKAVPEEA